MTEADKTLKEMEDFRKLSMDVLPLAKKLQEVLKEHGVEDLASLTLSPDGYMAFHTHETKWEMVRARDDKAARIRYEFSEEIEISEDEKEDI